MVLSFASGSMESIDIEESPKPNVPVKRKRSLSENRRRKVKKGEADNDEFVFETAATIGLFKLE